LWVVRRATQLMSKGDDLETLVTLARMCHVLSRSRRVLGFIAAGILSLDSCCRSVASLDFHCRHNVSTFRTSADVYRQLSITYGLAMVPGFLRDNRNCNAIRFWI
jgi:hypothetical protein